jgi:hypothetical protein
MKNTYINNTTLFEKKLQLAENNWNNFSIEHKEFVVEFLKEAYPNKRKLVNEQKWYNTLGDIVGIFDPTGVVDLVNGISYINQGYYLFGFLSIVSAVPYFGDVLAKPVMAMLKIGSPSTKLLKQALNLVRKGQTDKAVGILDDVVKTGGVPGKFVEGFGRIGKKLKEIIERLPESRLYGGLKKIILDWIDLFEKAAKNNISTNIKTGNFVRNFKTLSPIQQKNGLRDLIKASKQSGLFSSYKRDMSVWKHLIAGMPQLMSRNRSVRSLMRQTKTYLGFLDFLKREIFTEPEDLLNEMGQGDFERKMAEYLKTPQAQAYLKDDYGTDGNQYDTEVEDKSKSGTNMGNLFFSLQFLKTVAKRL